MVLNASLFLKSCSSQRSCAYTSPMEPFVIWISMRGNVKSLKSKGFPLEIRHCPSAPPPSVTEGTAIGLLALSKLLIFSSPKALKAL